MDIRHYIEKCIMVVPKSLSHTMIIYYFTPYLTQELFYFPNFCADTQADYLLYRRIIWILHQPDLIRVGSKHNDGI